MNLYKVIYTVFKHPLRLIFRVHVSGEENIPEKDGVILCANHTSMCDVLVLAVALKRQPRYMAKKELLKIPVVGAFLRALGAFSVDRGAADLGAVRKAISIIEDGGVVCMFPQGHRYPKVAVRSTPFRNGAGLIAYRAGCAVLPAYIKTSSGVVRFFRRTEVIFGKPIQNGEFRFTEGGNAEYKKAVKIMFERICDIGVEAGAPLELSAAQCTGTGEASEAEVTEDTK